MLGAEPHLPYERPPLSKDVLEGRMESERTFIHPAPFYENACIELALGTEVVAIDCAARRVVASDGSSMAYDRLLLTTGARSRALDAAIDEDAPVFYLRGLDDCMALRAAMTRGGHLIVIGAGFIGMEVAAVVRRAGGRVSVLEAAELPLARTMAPELSRYFRDLHHARGVEFHFGAAVESIGTYGLRARVRTTTGKVIEGDAVLVGIGATPNVELAVDAGISVNNGIVVDALGRTSDANVYAAGDVTNHFNPILGRHIRLESWQNAQNQAIAVAKNIVGERAPYAELPWFWSDQYEHNFQSVGWPDGWDGLVWRRSDAADRFTAVYLRANVPIAAASINNAPELRVLRKLIHAAHPVDPSRLSTADLRTLLTP